jgi:hypothetical protein
MATNAEGRSLAAPQARPEWIPTAAHRSVFGCAFPNRAFDLCGERCQMIR